MYRYLAIFIGLAILIIAFTRTLHLAPTQPRTWDVVVYGATPQGIATAIAAANQGLHVVLLNPNPIVGGVLTRGWLATFDLAHDGDGHSLQQGLFAKLYKRLGKEGSFDVQRALQVLNDMLRDAHVQVFGHRTLEAVTLDKQKSQILQVTAQGPKGKETFSAPFYVDASDNAELAAHVGAAFTIGRSDTGLGKAQMAATLIFRLTGVPWQRLCSAAIRENRETHDGAGCSKHGAWGFSPITDNYIPSDPRRFKLRGLNLALQDDGSVLVNALLIYGVDGTNPKAIAQAHAQASLEVKRVVTYLQQAAPRLFGTAQLSGVAPDLYLRGSRHLVGLYRLTAVDELYGHSFSDGVALGGYPLDGQVYLPGEGPYLLGTPLPYQVPLRSLIPKGLENLLVVSQAASFESTAAFSARVVPLQMALGQATGIAAAIASKRKLTFPEVVHGDNAIHTLRQTLLHQGARLTAPPVSSSLKEQKEQEVKDTHDPVFPKAASLLRRGLFSTPYFLKGGLHLGAPVTLGDFLADLIHFYRVFNLKTYTCLRSIEARFQADKPHPLSWKGAHIILQTLGDNQPIPSGQRYMSRREAAMVLWSLFHAQFNQGKSPFGLENPN
jgi:hypothetical protein